MSAERKIETNELRTIADPAAKAEQQGVDARVSFKDAGAADDVAPTPSPARELQEQLHDKISSDRKVSSVYDMGRILAASSGITALLGVFFFFGIW